MQESGENYLETIFLLKQKMGCVRSIDVANELGFSKASVSRAMTLLKNGEYIIIEGSGNIILTVKGEEKAKEIYEKHRYIRDYLILTLGVSQEAADKDACRIEHIISEEVFCQIKSLVDKEKEYKNC